jgi:rod shape-determining protein MreB
MELDERLEMDVQGRDQVAGLPRTITLSSSEVTEAITEPLAAILNVARAVLAKTPPELSSDIIDRGMALTGGGALLRELDTLLTRRDGRARLRRHNPIAHRPGRGQRWRELPVRSVVSRIFKKDLTQDRKNAKKNLLDSFRAESCVVFFKS